MSTTETFAGDENMKTKTKTLQSYKADEMVRIVDNGGVRFEHSDGDFGTGFYEETWDAESGASYVLTYEDGVSGMTRLWADETHGIAEEALGLYSTIVDAMVAAFDAEALYLATIQQAEDDYMRIMMAEEEPQSRDELPYEGIYDGIYDDYLGSF